MGNIRNANHGEDKPHVFIVNNIWYADYRGHWIGASSRQSLRIKWMWLLAKAKASTVSYPNAGEVTCP